MKVLTPLAIELDLINRLNEGAESMTRIAAIASTTSNSIRVKPRCFCMERSVVPIPAPPDGLQTGGCTR